MLFNSLQFAVFFPVVTLLYFWLPHRMRVALLLVASCVFYMAFVPKYILILAFLIVVDYSAGILIENARGHRRKLFLVMSLCANIGILGFFKYFNFLNDNLAALAHFLDWNYSIQHLRIILPIGLSFHTFQSMSYTIEVYRGHVKAERSPANFALYVMFYPQLVAGPIERPQNLLHQFREVHRFTWTNFVLGMQLMTTGLFKKMVIADRASLVVNTVYANPSQYSGAQLLVATWLFAVQIYCDFAGYTEIARGAAKVMGFDLMLNFNRPYLSTSITDFWRRWHISLSTWFRDYLYVPLGGNRVSRARMCVNLAIVFVVSGLWHGANWTFIVWGALHALFMVVYVLTEWPRSRLAALSRGSARAVGFLGWLLTFNLVTLAWVFFRAATMSDAMFVLRSIFSRWSGLGTAALHPGLDALQFALVLAVIVVLIVLEVVSTRTPMWETLARQPRWLRWSAYYSFGMAFAILLFLSPQHGPQPFVYFQF
jgi:D-alanyl-lipoteichoic acid acyltransferase DltB (MBOAT superfamily)